MRQTKKRAPEWVTWELELADFPADSRNWFVENGLTYLDHTDEFLVLTCTDAVDPEIADVEVNRVFKSENDRKLLIPIFDLGFRSIRWHSFARQWYQDKEFLKGRGWRAVRYATLVTQGNWCRACGRKPPHVELHVDHIKSRSRFPLLALSLENLQVLCRDCNVGKGADDQTNWIVRPLAGGDSNARQ